MRILFLVPYPSGQAPSQRFRFEQYHQLLKNNGYEIEVRSFLDLQTWMILYTDGAWLAKGFGVFKGFFRRIVHLIEAFTSDYVFIHRELTPIGLPIFEWVLSKVMRKRIIYDFDDAIWLPNTSVENKLIASIKCHGKVGSICSWSWKISCGNEFIANYARKFNENVVVNPTTIDPASLKNALKRETKDVATIGWTGTHSTSKYLKKIVPIIQELERSHDFRFLIISNKNPNISLKSVEYRKWRKKSEIEDLMEIDIGIMPLDNDQWAEGKCGFKALQYLALQIPALVSPVGVNKEIVENGVNGYHCDSFEDWRSNLINLMMNMKLRKQLGANGKEKVIQSYSTVSNANNFLSLFKD